MQFRIIFIVLVVACSAGCRLGATAISEEELQVLIPRGMQASTALQLLSSRGYRIDGPDIRDADIGFVDSKGEDQRRVWKQKNIAACYLTLNSNPFDLVYFSNVIYVVIDDNMRVEETISDTHGFDGFGPARGIDVNPFDP
jgi:hypothetical protein